MKPNLFILNYFNCARNLLDKTKQKISYKCIRNFKKAHAHSRKKEKEKIKVWYRDLDLLWMEQGIALCLPVDLYRCISLVLTHVVFLSFLYGFKALYDDS